MTLRERIEQLNADERVQADQIIRKGRELLVAIEGSDPRMTPATRKALDHITFGVVTAIERERA